MKHHIRLFLASVKGSTEIVKDLLDKGANTEAKGEFARTALINGN